MASHPSLVHSDALSEWTHCSERKKHFFLAGWPVLKLNKTVHMKTCASCRDITNRLDNKAHMYQVLSKLGFGADLIPTQIFRGKNVTENLEKMMQNPDLSQRYYLKSDVGCCARQSYGGTVPELLLWVEKYHHENNVADQYVLQPDMSSKCVHVRSGRISEQRVLVQVVYPNTLKVCRTTFQKTHATMKENSAAISPECHQFVLNIMTKYLEEFPVECEHTINLGIDLVRRRKGSNKTILLEINVAEEYSPCACGGKVQGFTKHQEFPVHRLVAVTRSSVKAMG